jgi:AcrR family transcriptional regulator
VDDNLLPLGRVRAERADAVRNRERLLAVAREMIAEDGVASMTMDGLAERAGLGKGTVFRRFKTRAGIFAALIDDDESAFQQAVLGGPPPLGPGADAVTRLIAFGRARIEFLFDHHAMVRAAVESARRGPVGATTLSGLHIRVLLVQAQREGLLGAADPDSLAIQLTAALEGPLLLYLATDDDAGRALPRRTSLADGWQFLIQRIAAD